MAAKEYPNTITDFVTHHKEYKLMTTHEDMHIILTIPPHTMEYNQRNPPKETDKQLIMSQIIYHNYETYT